MNKAARGARAETQLRERVCFVVTIAATADAFLLGHIAALAKVYDVTLVTSCRDKDYLRRRGLAVDVVHAPLVRTISPIRDCVCLLALWRIFRRGKYRILHTVTPKAGLLALLAAAMARIPVRIHTFTGQIWATRSGFRRTVFKSLDGLIGMCATHVLVDSRSQMEFLLRERVVPARKASVLGNGSISGVDTARFRPQAAARSRVRASLEIPSQATVFAYIGRLRKEKGVLDLAAAFARLCATHTDAYLMFVGADEESLTPEIRRLCASCAGRLRFTDHTPTPEDYMASADILCLPSYREGFGSVVIEAAACQVPSLASRIYGVTDAVIDQVTGILHEPGNIDDLANGMRRLMENPALRTSLGLRARTRAETEFAAEKVTAAMVEYYATVLGGAKVDWPAAEGAVRT
jgi:glycosyltransferase involved in cell wall biosynthesis